jgi:hypothetical protein
MVVRTASGERAAPVRGGTADRAKAAGIAHSAPDGGPRGHGGAIDPQDGGRERL